MKKLFVLLFVTLVGTTACHKVPVGHKGVKVYTMGSSKGMVEEVSVGFHALGIGIDYENFPVFNQTIVWTQNETEGSISDESFTFSVDGMPVNVDIGLQYSLVDGKIADLYVKYRRGIVELTDKVIRNVVRDSLNKNASKYNMDRLITGGMNTLLDDVQKDLIEYFKNEGITIVKLSLVNAARYPKSIVSAIEAKNQATQNAIQRENELRSVEAEAKKRIEFARGEYEAAKYQALANRILSQSMSANLIRKMEIEKWNGALPEVMTGTSTFMFSRP